MDKKNIKKDPKIKQLNTKKQFYQRKKLNKNFSQGNIQSKNKNKINKSKTIVRNNSIKRNKLNLPQKKIPVPKTSGKKFTRKKLDTKIMLNINNNKKINCNSNTINSIYPMKNFANTTKGKNIHHLKKCDTNNLCKNLLNELSFNNNDIYNNNKYNAQSNYNTINVDERATNMREYNKSINTDLLFSLKKVNSFKNLNSNHKGKMINNSTKLVKSKIKININDNITKKNINYLNNTNYRFKAEKKISTLYNDSENKSQFNSKILSFENNYNSNSTINNNRSINNKSRIKSKNGLSKGKNGYGNYSYQSAYSTASTGQTKINNK